MRGTRPSNRPAYWNPGIIPAYAGNTAPLSIKVVERRDHPRVCGEHRNTVPSVQRMTGSSPRMRGTLDGDFMEAEHVGIIPAYAGNTILS